MRKAIKKIPYLRAIIYILVSICFISFGLGALWVSSLKMPDLNSFQDRKIIESTKIYDRTGTILLYDTGTNAKMTFVPISDISPFVQKAAIAIEDSNFYTNYGVEPSSIIRALLKDVTTGEFAQGASTITQQVVKNSLLTKEKTITRKIKEFVLALKLTRMMTKDQILEIYLNETPFGGTLYGVEEASQEFFGKQTKDVTLAESAYLAAIPQAPTFYSPYGPNRERLDARQKLVLSRMKTLGFIDEDQYQEALEEKVIFNGREAKGIRAPHFVMFVREYLYQKYGEDAVQSGGLKVITTLDYKMQQKAEDVVVKFGESLANNFNASNTAMIAIDPKTGDILTMVGSRNYFDNTIDGNFNITLAKRQPGSTFKPIVYATAFKKGYTPETVLFDVETEFSMYCTPEGKPKNPADDPEKVCYSPDEYDHIFEGPMSIRRALAQSRNIPAVKALYLAGIRSSIQTAQDLGITSLTDPNRYGLTLVLGGGEVSLLELTSAYGVFANDGVKNPYRSVLEITDNKGNLLEKSELKSNIAIEPEIARQISSILSDNSVRMNSLKPIAQSAGRTVAIKTGTTNDYKDVWTVGYTPNLVVGAWAGNNDNTPMKQNVAGLIISPLWAAFMAQVTNTFPPEEFQTPPTPPTDGKPVLRGIWQGGISYKVDSISGKLATEYTPSETLKETVFNGVHTILHWVNKDDPKGPNPTNQREDSQYEYWEYAVRKWFNTWQQSNPGFKEATNIIMPTDKDDVHGPGKNLNIIITSPAQNSEIDPNSRLNIQIKTEGKLSAKKTDVYINNKFIMTAESNPLDFSLIPADVSTLNNSNTLTVIVIDEAFNKSEASVNFTVKK